MTGLVAFRLATFVTLALGLAACGVISTLVEGWKYAKAVEADLESATGVKPSVGFKWENGRLLTVTVAYPQLYEKKPLAALADIVAARSRLISNRSPRTSSCPFHWGDPVPAR
jgi:hypothetical protein